MSRVFKKKFGPIGAAIAASLGAFSFDVVGIIAKYLMCAIANSKTMPVRLYSIGDAIHEQRKRGECLGVACDPNCKIWCCFDTCVRVFNDNGDFVFETLKSSASYTPGRAITMDHRQREVLITGSENGKCAVFVCALDGVVRRRFSAPDNTAVNSNGIFVGICIDRYSSIRLCERVSGNIWMCRRTGENIQIPPKNYGLKAPHGITVLAEGGFAVSDQSTCRIHVFNSLDQPQSPISNKGFGSGYLLNPMGLTEDASGNIFVCDSGNNRVQVFTIRGLLVAEIYENLSFPQSICIDAYGKIIVGDNKGVHVFAYPL
jgi:hypothetical protein